jgi:RimJ/RimL family protein N-acetyltransferase
MTGQETERPNELIEHAPVTLRRFRADDRDALFQTVTASLDHLRPWMPWAADYSLASAEEYLAGSVKSWDEGTEYNYAIMTATPGGTALAGVDRVEIVHDELNLASAGIPRKLGFTEVGRRPLDFRPPAGSGTGVVWRLTR